MSHYPANYTIRTEPGDTYTRNVRVTEKATGDPVDLTDYTVRMKIWDEDGDDLYVLTAGSGLTVTAATGTIQFVLTDSQTWALRFTEAGWYRLKITAPSGVETTIIKGRVTSNKWDGDLSDDS